MTLQEILKILPKKKETSFKKLAKHYEGTVYADMVDDEWLKAEIRGNVRYNQAIHDCKQALIKYYENI